MERAAMADFLEERLSDLIRYGSSYQDDYAVNVVASAGGQEYRSLIHPYPVRRFDISYLLDEARTYAELMAVYHRAHGTFAGFRARCFDEWSSNGAKGTPTATDQPCLTVSAGSVYQLIKRYGTNGTAGASGYPYRVIKKPVASTTRVAVAGVESQSPMSWTVDTTTGLVTFVANTKSITAISKAASAVITLDFGHGFLGGESVYVSGVSGMTQINGARYYVTATSPTTITVAVNSTAFSTYTSGGSVTTVPQSGEAVTGGFEFDFPVRFATTLPVGQDYPGYRPVDGVSLVELLNP
jgi:uncharacterized protein (TIGR02217 family)